MDKTKEPLKVLIVSSEAAPFAKTGGLGDVIGSLPQALRELGVDVRVLMPRYRSIKWDLVKDATYISSFEVSLGWRKQSASVFSMTVDGLPVYLIQNDYYFGRDGLYGFGDDYERFGFFSKAAVEFVGTIDFMPDVIHFHDWQTGLVPVYLNDVFKRFTFYRHIKTVFTIHNLQYQGVFGRETLGNLDLNDGYFSGTKLEFHGNISFMKAAILYADAITTVSETYAHEIQTPAYGYGLDGLLRSCKGKITGILNGIDLKKNDPQTDKLIFTNYSATDLAGKAENKQRLQQQLNLPQSDRTPVIGIVSRLVDQKGFDLIAGCIDELMSRDLQLVILGTGDGRYEHMFHYMSNRYPNKVSANITFNEELAQKIYAGSDMLLMPSLFEPCGLGQMIAMRYGTLPIVRETGGLADTVYHFVPELGAGNGFTFRDYLSSGLMWAIDSALGVYKDTDMWEKAVVNAMISDFSWKKSAARYLELYKSLRG